MEDYKSKAEYIEAFRSYCTARAEEHMALVSRARERLHNGYWEERHRQLEEEAVRDAQRTADELVQQSELLMQGPPLRFTRTQFTRSTQEDQAEQARKMELLAETARGYDEFKAKAERRRRAPEASACGCMPGRPACRLHAAAQEECPEEQLAQLCNRLAQCTVRELQTEATEANRQRGISPALAAIDEKAAAFGWSNERVRQMKRRQASFDHFGF